MYLALILDEFFVEQLRDAVQDSVTDSHLTLVHSPEKDIELPEVPMLIRREVQEGGVEVDVLGPAPFGPPGKRVWALRLAKTSQLRAMRFAAEADLRTRNLKWSSEWLFNPHITLVKADTITLKGVLPEKVRFVRAEWRP